MGLPLIVPIGLSMAQSIPNWMAGIKQSRTADKLQSELQRPDFEIPESQKQALQSAKNQASMTRLPGQSAIEGRLDQTTANQLDMIERMGVGGATSLNAASQAFSNQQSKENELGVQAAENYNRNQQMLRSQLDRMSDWEFKKWTWDKQLPYQNKAEAIAALREGSMRNIDNAFKDTFGGAANMLLADSLYGNKDLSWVDRMFGGGGKSTDPSSVTPEIMPDNLQGMPIKPTKQEFFKQQGLEPLPINPLPANVNDNNMPWNQGQYGGDSPYNFMKPNEMPNPFAVKSNQKEAGNWYESFFGKPLFNSFESAYPLSRPFSLEGGQNPIWSKFDMGLPK